MHSRKIILACTIIFVLFIVYKYDILCALGNGTIILESSGSEKFDGLMLKNGCNVHHTSTEPGVSVVGFGRGKISSTHIGYMEEQGRVDYIQKISSEFEKMASQFRYVGIVANGGTHKKPALSRLRDDLAIQINDKDGEYDFNLVPFFKKYDMGKFLTVDRGCCQPYIYVYDVAGKKKVVERIGAFNSNLTHDLGL